jgi:hypothetical protein
MVEASAWYHRMHSFGRAENWSLRFDLRIIAIDGHCRISDRRRSLHQTDPNSIVNPIDHPPSTLVIPPTRDNQPDAPPPVALTRPRLPAARTVALVMLVTLLAWLALVAVYLVISVPGEWFPAAAPKSYAANKLVLARGSGQLVDQELHVTEADSTGVTLLSSVVDLDASDYPTIAWIAADIPEGAKVRLLWRNDSAPQKLNAIDVPVEGGRTLPVLVANKSAWIGRVTGLALAIQGTPLQPIRIRGVIAKPMGALEILGDRAGEWFAFEGWSGTSINTITGGADFQGFPLPVLIALTVALAGTAIVLIERRRPGTLVASTPLVLGAIFLIGWLILDARWTANLMQQERYTAERYAGKSSRDKHLAGEDAQLFAFVERALQVLPSRPVRIFVAADAGYFRGRAAYLLYPHSAFLDPHSNELQWADKLRSGDWLLVYQQRGIKYDAGRQMIRWETGLTTSAELKLLEPGAALFRIR